MDGSKRAARAPARRSRPILAVVAIAVCVLVFAGLSLARHQDPSPPEGAGTVRETTEGPLPDSATVPASIELESAQVRAALDVADGAWAGRITRVEASPALRRPLLTVSTDIAGDETGEIEAFTTQLVAFAESLRAEGGTPLTYRIVVLSADSERVGVALRTDKRWRLDTPAAPSDVTSLEAWLAAVYGTGPGSRDPWLSQVVRVGDPAEDPEGLVRVETDLDPASAGDRIAAQTILDAVNSSGATFAPGVRVLFADDRFEWVGVLDGVDPYAP